MSEPHCDSVKPAGNVAALSEKNPPPNKSHAATLMQRQTQRHDKFQLCDRPLCSTDPDFENVASLAPIMKFLPLPLIIGLSICSRRHAINSITRAETHHGISLSADRRSYRLQLRAGIPPSLPFGDVALASGQPIRHGVVRHLKVSTSRSRRNPRHLRLISSAPEELRHESLITNQ